MRAALVGAAAAAGLAGVSTPLAAAARSDGRHYELATPTDKLGHSARSPILSGDGTVLAFDTEPGNGLPGDPSHSAAANPYLSQRSPTGWAFSSWGLKATEFGELTRAVDVTPTLTTRIYLAATTEQWNTGAAAFYRRDSATGPPTRIGPTLQVQPGGRLDKGLTYHGASADLRHIVLSAQPPNVLLPGEPAPAVESALYEIAQGADDELRRVDVANDGSVLSPVCGAVIGARGHTQGAISTDGRRIAFTTWPEAVGSACGAANGGPGTGRIFSRIDGTETVEVSASECQRGGADPCAPVVGDPQFEAASSDGRRVFLTSPDQLVDGDTDASPDLYLYDFDAPLGDRLTRLSSAAAADAGFQGFLRAAPDGSRVYYVARGVLANNANDNGDQAAAGADNLYVQDVASGQTTFVATMDPNDAGNWSGADGSGIRTAAAVGTDARRLVFASAARLTADDTDTATDLFRFDADDGSLVRLSIGDGDRGNDEVPVSSPGADYQNGVPLTQPRSPVSADGSKVLFHTSEALVADDTNGAGDVYEWADGRVGLVSDGQDPGGAGNSGYAMAISADGGTAAFATARALVPADRDTATDVYVLRSGDDVTAPVVEDPPPCAGDACQGPAAGPPPLLLPATPGFEGPGGAAVGRPTPPRRGLRVAARTRVRGSVARLRVRVPTAGRLRVTGPGLRPATRTVRKAGTYTVVVRLTPAARRALSRNGTSERRARLALTAAGRPAAVATARITYASPRSSSRPRSAGAARKDRS